MSLNFKIYDLGAEHGRVLATRDLGRDVGRQVADQLAGAPALLLGFWNVEVASPSFLDELLRALHSQLWGGTSNRLLVATGYNDDVRESLVIVLDRNGGSLAALEDGQLDLLGGPEHLKTTLEKAQQLKRFTARELADELEVKLPNLHARLKALTEWGALARDEDSVAPPASGTRPQNEYHAPDVQVLTGAIGEHD